MAQPPTKRIWLLRHAQTEWSQNGRHTGSRSDIPLTGEGEAMARELAPVVSGIPFGLVLVSPMNRTRRTAELAGLLDGAQEDPDLLEWDYGDYEGITTAQIREQDPGWTIWTHPCPNGETGEQVAARARNVIDRALAAEGDVALVSHGHYLRVLCATWLHLAPQHGADFMLSTGTVCLLGFEHEYRTILHWNERVAGVRA
ncbi:MAG: histidine phosphatase family protein [Planctomycetota bacterium]|nr:histidine phosphatase family protein [Planctomycetota bacterium]MEC8734054.1 histidine phosphatase family protein [Planctomycetota bacterium]MEC8817722.1 histidine phosphatase family protein [Planctomycetota bacterium]MED5508457.1 histidine phosphatase family protein [Planctomycetota bacterium]